jgi:indolepyruvate ferredoxin oxidoreductase
MNAPVKFGQIALDDKYTLDHGRAFMSGTQALVRLPMLQRQRDQRDGRNTAGFISGYRGSPLGGVDQALWKAKSHLAKHDIVFRPGLNEDLAATSVWGSQQVNLRHNGHTGGVGNHARVDGVFAMWYGKGPGVDRCGDVFKHANAAGSSRHGGVLVLAGDDHGAKSSSLPHQSDHIFKACGIPVFYPSTVQEYLDLGLHGWAMSRYSGLWMAMKTVTEVVEASASVEIDSDRVKIILPEDFAMPVDGLNIRWPDPPLAQEARLLDYKFYAALAYVRANKLNYTSIDSERAWFGIVSGGKAYLDLRQALDDLGLDKAACNEIGIRVYKCGVVWPLEAQGVREFATGLQEILVVEEKRQMIEYALKEELYNWRDDVRPRIYGKFDEKDGRGGEWAMPMGQWLLPAHYELSPAMIAKVIAGRLLNPGQHASRFSLSPALRSRIQARIAVIEAKEQALAVPTTIVDRVPTFCAGCPHNTSTHIPEGSRAVAGIGCHYMATWMPERHTDTFTHMGGEGVPWIGQAPFSNERHIFANLGDGTYFHSGILAVRASIAAQVNITYKILYNDAVAMTGGQPIDGSLTVPQLVAQMRAESAKKIVIVTDEPDKYQDLPGFDQLTGIEIHHRDHLDAVQRELREIPGCTILVYDQTCASEKRRRRKKVVDGVPGFPDPAKRVVINDAVCEGCGDCSVQSSCVAIEPLDTEFGRKRQINQSACNKDFSCVKGFCPSFVTVEGGQLRKHVSHSKPTTLNRNALPNLAPSSFLADVSVSDWLQRAAALAVPEQLPMGSADYPTYGILVTGVGGSGVVTIGQLLGMAAHVEGKGVSVLDMAGLAQKGGAVSSHVQLAEKQEYLHSTRIATGEADLLIGCDLVVAAGQEALSKLRRTVTRAVINDDVAPTSDFIRNRDWALPADALKQNILDAAGVEQMEFVNANALALGLMGDALYTNPLLMGYAWQRGWIPLKLSSIETAIKLNAMAVSNNLNAFAIGRLAANDWSAIEAEAKQANKTQDANRGKNAITSVIEFKRSQGLTSSLAQLLATRVEYLSAYQNSAYADRYLKLVEQVKLSELKVSAQVNNGLTVTPLTEIVAKNLFKLMAYKDEYEVARLMSAAAFKAKIATQFDGDYTLSYHLAPPLLSKVDPKTGRPKKMRFGAWMGTAFKLLAPMKFLRGTALDLFGYSEERRAERALVHEYSEWVTTVADELNTDNLALAKQIAALPQEIRGFGPVKETAMLKMADERRRLIAHWR